MSVIINDDMKEFILLFSIDIYLNNKRLSDTGDCLFNVFIEVYLDEFDIALQLF